MSGITRLFQIITVTWLLSQAPQVKAREFVVSQAANAADTNPGTSQEPLRTISAAASRVQAGDKVLIHAGDYRETVIIKASGTPDAPIVFEAARGEAPVIKGSDVLTGWTRKSPNVWKAKLPPILSRSEKNDDPSYWRTNNIQQVFIEDGILTDAVHLRIAKPGELQEGTFFCDQPNGEIYASLKQAQDPNRMRVEGSTRGAWLYVFGSHVSFRGLAFRHSSTLAFAPWPACVIKGNNVVLDHCTFTWGDFVGISLGGKNDTLIDSIVACNGCDGIGGTGEGHVIERCRILYNNINRYYFDWHAGGMKLIPDFVNGRITRNEVAYNMGHGIWLDAASNGNLIESNVCHDNEGAGIVVEISERNRVFNNICFANRNPLTADFTMPAENNPSEFRAVRRGGQNPQQLLYHAGDGRGIYISSAPETKVFHNTCYLNEGEGICVEGPVRKIQQGAMSARDCEVMNNISAYNKGAQLIVRRNGSDPDTHGNRSDCNLLMARGAVLAEAGWGAYSMQLKDWQQRSNNDVHSIQSDPSFVMAAMGDFRLLPISPAALAAPALPEVTTEFSGEKRPNGKVSMGACEVTAADYPRPFFQIPP